jgi:hypothetical protein
VVSGERCVVAQWRGAVKATGYSESFHLRLGFEIYALLGFRVTARICGCVSSLCRRSRSGWVVQGECGVGASEGQGIYSRVVRE